MLVPRLCDVCSRTDTSSPSAETDSSVPPRLVPFCSLLRNSSPPRSEIEFLPRISQRLKASQRPATEGSFAPPPPSPAADPTHLSSAVTFARPFAAAAPPVPLALRSARSLRPGRPPWPPPVSLRARSDLPPFQLPPHPHLIQGPPSELPNFPLTRRGGARWSPPKP